MKKLSDVFLSGIRNKFIRFCFVGCLNAAFGYGVYALCILVGLKYFWAVLISNVLGVIWNFFTTGHLVFENTDRKLWWKFVLCYVINYGINTGAVKIFLLLGMNEYWAGLFATPVAALCSFFILKLFVYRDSGRS